MESRGSAASDGGLWLQYHHRTQRAAVSFAYATRAEAEAAATHAQAVVEKAVSVLPLFNPPPRRRGLAEFPDKIAIGSD